MRTLAIALAGILAATIAPLSPAAATPAAAKTQTSGGGQVIVPTLVARATLDADYLADGPPSGAKVTAANGRTGPFAGQVIPGFSAALHNVDGTFWGLPDNGFGAKANSADFLLRLYLVKPRWEDADGGQGRIAVQRFISFRDPNKVLDFPIVNGATRQRLLTGADFDVESIVRAKDGTLWVGEEFGPFLLHFSASGVLLEKPIKLSGAMGPDNPYLGGRTPTIRASKGFEAMTGSADGRYLYPILEGYRADATDLRVREIHQFDLSKRRYTGKVWRYQADADDTLVADVFRTTGNTMLVLERDDFWGEQAVIKRVYRVKLNATERGSGMLRKELVADLMKIANPDRIGTRTDSNAYGIAPTFRFPMQSVETLLQIAPGRLLIGNDNNYPGNDARYKGQPDDTEMVIIDLDRQRPAKTDATVIAHRGASGYRPEHTLAAYELAIQQCAEWIEPDLTSTSDGVLVARHENEIGGTTNVADRPEFAARKTTKLIDGDPITGWFTEDFTLAELRSLRAKERLPQLRSTRFDGLYQVPTFAEVVDFARRSTTCSGKPVGVIPETKHPTYFASIGLALEPKVLEVLGKVGLTKRNSRAAIQSFEVGNLKWLNKRIDVQLVQLVDCQGAPYDLKAAGNPTTYADMVTAAGLRAIAKYADTLGACKDRMIPRNPDGTLGTPTSVIADAHAAGLQVTGWTFRAENNFLPVNFRRGTDPAAIGDLAGEIRAFVDAGMDNLFSDHPDLAVAAVER